jgi:hypothetical protein
MIESVFNVQPLAARETSSDVGNLLSTIDFHRQPKSAPALPMPQPVKPESLCASSINPGGGLARSDDEANGFVRLEEAALARGWPVYR